MIVLVTGAAGNLGTRTCAVLAAAGHRVRALEHARPAEVADERVRCDLLDRSGLDGAVAGVDAVVHLAAVTHARNPRRYDEINVDGTRLLAEAAAAAGVGRFVHVSSTAVDPAGGAYSRSKRDAEEVLRAAVPAATIVRLAEVVGAGAAEGIDRMLAAARRGRRVPVVGRGLDVHRPVDVGDAARAIVAALDHPGRTFALAGDPVSAAELVRGAGGTPLPVPVALVRLASLAARVLPLPVYPDQLARLRAPKAPSSPEDWVALGIVPRVVR